MSLADEIFIKNCRQIIGEGFWDSGHEVRPRWPDGSAAHTVKAFGIVNRYRLCEEFPILTLRKTNLRGAIDELLWIWQRKSSNIRDLGTRIWDAWADGDGSIGKAYGYQLGIKHIYPEGEFDQVDRLLYDLANNPLSRRMVTNIYNHADLHEMRLYPCAHSVTFNVAGGRLNAVLSQRSQDMLVANNWNVCQYAALVHMLARASGLIAGELVHVIADAHIYDRHIPIVEKMLGKRPYAAPAMRMREGAADFYGFCADDFALDGYEYHRLGEKVPVAV
ncbi:MAG: thymidylate synthase [Clostridiales bacterium]|jgi:thymidylate synthase|nr:thymidylate synthase [Clostridiales bacterium]